MVDVGYTIILLGIIMVMYYGSYRMIKNFVNATKKGFKAYLLFVIQRNDCDKFQVAGDIDPVYAQTLIKAVNNNVKILCYDCKFSSKGIILNNKIRFQINE